MSNDNVISIVGNQNAQITDGNSSLITAGNGNDNLSAGTNSTIVAGNGSDIIAAAAGSAITVGNGNDTITDGANGLIFAGNGNDLISTGVDSIVIAGSGGDLVIAGDGSSVAVGNGNDTIRAGANSLIVAGNGNDALTAGANSIIDAGSGNDTITAGNRSGITAGNGNDTVVVGAGSAVVVGNGRDVLTAGANSSITAGSGSDVIHMGANDKVTVGSGVDTFVLPTSGQVTVSAPTSVTVNEDGSVALAIAAASTGFGFGLESIAGFNPAKDSIVVYSSQFANFATILADAKQVGQNTVITGDAGDTITLQGVKLSSLTASDFTFLTTPISISISGIPAGVTLSDTAGAIAVTNGSATLTPAQLAGLKLTAGEVTSANLTVTTTDLGTGASVSKTIALTVNPVAPTLATPASLSVNADGVVALGITETPFDPRDTVSLKIAGVPSDATLSAGTKNSDGSWTLTPDQLNSLSLTAGNPTTTTLTITATNTEGVTAATQKTIQLSVLATLQVTFDTVAFTDTGVQGDHITNNNSVTLSGTVTDSLSVSQVQVLNGTTPVGNATIDNANHTWSLTINLPDGNYNNLSVKAVDSVGNTASAAPTQYVTVDTAPPVVSQSESVSGLTSSKADIVTVSVTDQVGVASVVIYDDQTGQKLGNATLAGSTWTYSAAGLTDGIHKFYAIVTDIAGNTTKTVDLPPVTVDTAPPTASATGSISGLTNQTSETITVNASDAYGIASVVVEDNGVAIGTAAQTSPGVYALTANNLSQGSHDFTAAVTNLAGDQTITNAIASTVDTTPPTALATGLVTGPTNQTSETITVTATDANGVASVVIDDNGVAVGSATQTAPGVYALTESNLAQGNHDFAAVVTDNAGNITTSNHVTSLVDTTPPQITFDTVSYDHTGLANFTKDPAVTMSGTTSDNVTVAGVQVFNGSQLLGTATVDNVAHTWTLTTNLAQGTYANLNAVATDEAGNAGAATNAGTVQSLQVDTTPPAATLDHVSFVDTGVPNDGITDNNLVTMSGTTADNVSVTQVEVLNGSQVLGNATVDNASHTWSLSTNLADGTYANLQVEAIDEAGNTTISGNTSANQSIQIDTAPPVVTFTGVVLANPADSSGIVTNDGIVTLSGTVTDAVALSQVEVYNGTELLGAATIANGTWTLATTLSLGSNQLPATYNQLHATATDIAGNTADASTQHIVTVIAETGQVTDGYIQGATVFADANGTGIQTPGEAFGITNAYGHFTLGPGTTTGNLVMVGGTDTSTGLPFTGVLTAPSGSTQVTPLTTLVDAVAAANGGNVAAASQSVATALGIDPSVDLTTTDPLSAAYQGDSQVFVAASKVLNTVSMVASAVSGSGASDFSTAATNAFSALATQIVSNAGSLDLNNSATVTDVVGSTLAATSSSSLLTSAQTADIATVVTSLNTATDQAVTDSSGSSTATLLTNVSATSIVAQGSTSTALQQATSGSGDLSSVVADNTGTALSNNVGAAVGSVGNVAPAPPTFVGLTPTDASPNDLNLVHYTLAFSDPVTGVSASDFSLTTSGLTGASIASITPVAGSNGTQYTIAVNAGTGDGTLALNFTGTTVLDLAGNLFVDQATHTGIAYVVDQDTAQQAALSLHVTNTQINSAGSAIFNFTVGGLESDDSGTVTFTDGVNTVSVAVSGGQAAYTANLGALSDGPITSSLALNNDSAGNTFMPVAGTSAVVLSGVNVVNGVSSNNGTLQVVQNGIGDITVTPTGPVVGTAGDGVIAEQSASGSGNVVVTASGSTTGNGTGSVGLLAENLNAANTGNVAVTSTGGASGAYGVEALQEGNGNVSIEAGGSITGSAQYGVWAISHGSGSETIVADAGSTINAASSGVIINNRDLVLAASAGSVLTATNNGTINSGATSALNGTVPAGLAAGYNGSSPLSGPSVANTNVNGTVIVDNNGTITAAGYGIEGFNFGNGNITINNAAGTSVTGAQFGIGAFDESKGTGSIAVNVAANAAITATTFIGIQAVSFDVGSISIATSAGDILHSGSTGINAVDEATSIAASVNSTITVIANGTIESGTGLTNGAAPNGINALYLGGTAPTVNNNVAGDVVVQSNAIIVAAANSGINANNFGTGNVTVTTGAASSITAPGGGINANAHDGGSVSVTNAGSITAGSGINVFADQSGNVTLENDGQITATAFSGINATDNAAGSTGSVIITNTGTVVGGGTAPSISVNANATGAVTIDNSGTIGSSSSSSPAIIENGGGSLTINNSGQINGAISANNITAIAGDAIDLTTAGGTVGNPANSVLSPGGAITGAANGISDIQNAVGDITINSTATVAGQAGDGIIAEQSASGSGSIVVNASGSTTGTGTGSVGLLAENLNAANTGNIAVTSTGGASGAYGVEALQEGNGNVSIEAGGSITGSAQYGVWAISHGSGSETIVADAGATINAASSGVIINNRDLVLAASAGSVLTATNNGTINSGATFALNGTVPAGLAAGYNGSSPLNGPSVSNTNVNGTVIVNNNGTITAAGYGIEGFNFGNGDITINDGAGTSVTGAQFGIGAFDQGKGTGNIAVNVGANAAITATTFIGIQAVSYDVGNVSIATSAGDILHSGGTGINAVNGAASIAASVNSTLTVIANGTIDSGTDLTNGASPSGINAGYLGGTTSVINGNVAGSVVVQSNADIVAAANTGINAFNFGAGNVTVTTGATSSITAPGAGINANAIDGGNVNITNGGSITAGTGINATADQSGNLVIENDGQITATTFSGINVTDNAAGSAGSVTITNTGTVVGAAAHAAINISENSTGAVIIDNSGTIGLGAVAANAPAVSESGNGAVVVNNSGQINGSIYTNGTGDFTGIFNNAAGAAWNTGFLGDDGSIVASGAGSTIATALANSGVTIGDHATGGMTIEAGAELATSYLQIGNAAGSVGTLTATGAGSDISIDTQQGGADVGFSGHGTLLLEAGATFVADFLNIGQNVGSVGAVTITDPGTTVDTTAGQFQNIGVGFDGAASLTIANHASVTTTNMEVGINYDAGITDTLDINNAVLTVANNINIADAGTANATVENGGILNSGSLNIGNQATATGTLTVDGAGSVVNVNGLSLGSQGGTATLSLTNGGAVDVGPATTIAGAVHVASGFNVQGSGTIHGDLVDDGFVSANGALLDVTGNTSGSGTLAISNAGHLELGSSVAASDTVLFQGSTGSLTLDQSSSFAALIQGFTGDGTQAGSDQIDLKDINYASLSETFDQVNDTLSVSDGTHSALLHFAGTYVQANFSFASDGNGGTIVYDPPVPNGKAPPAPVGTDHLAFNFDNLNHGGQSPSTLLEDLAHMAAWDVQQDSHQNHPGPAQWQALLQGHDGSIPDTIVSSELHASQFHYHLV